MTRKAKPDQKSLLVLATLLSGILSFAAINPESGTVTYQYDDSGNVARKTDGRNVATNFGNYDGMNRALAKSYTDGSTLSVFYCYGDHNTAELANYCPGSRNRCHSRSRTGFW